MTQVRRTEPLLRLEAAASPRPVGRDRAYLPELEGLRGVAALMVTANHVGVYTGVVASPLLFGTPGNGVVGAVLNRFEIALPVFFALAGVLLFRPWAQAALRGERRPATRPYLWRRALRILPGYWVLCVVAILLLDPDARTSVWFWLRTLLLLQIYQDDAIPTGMGQTWSLSVEVSFYLLLPLFGWLTCRWARRAAGPRRAAVWMLVAVPVFVVVQLVWTVYTHRGAAGPYPISQFWLPQYCGFFAAGAGLAVLGSHAELEGGPFAIARFMGRHPMWCWAGAILTFAALCSPVAGASTTDYPGVGAALVTQVLELLFVVLLIGPLSLPDRGSVVQSAILANPVAGFLGRISYGIFLWHVVLLDAFYAWTGTGIGGGDVGLVFLLVFGGTLLVATLSSYLVERPALSLRPRLGQAPTQPSMVVAASPGRSTGPREATHTEGEP